MTDDEAQVRVVVPDLADLIALKKMRASNTKDDEDLRYLEVRRALEASGRLRRP